MNETSSKNPLAFEAVTRQEIALEEIAKKLDTIIKLLQQQSEGRS